ncbi:MAG: signal peptidase I [Tenericutes bacterium 4572_104]|nr:MAG: signal peptidase I [Tenericutes bacterium 4572_104]
MIDDLDLQESSENLKEYNSLMKKSLRIIIGFFIMFAISVILFIILQKNKFFIFNLNRTFKNVPSPFIAEVFSIFFFVIIIFAFISFVVLTFAYFKNKKGNIVISKKEIFSYKNKYNIADIFSVVPIFLIVVMIINGYFFSLAQVEGISMQPTFCDNDAVIIKYVEEYKNQDIVILQEEGLYLIKRLVAQGGDKLVVNSTGVYVNGIKIEDTIWSGTIEYDLVIPEGYYYVLGDNRNNSRDSRMFGLVKEEDMLGKVIIKISNSTCAIG